MTSSKTFIGTILAILVIALFALFITIERPTEALGDGTVAVNPRTSTTTTVGPQGAAVVKTQIFASNTSCKSRVISAPGTSAIMISFDDIAGAGNVGSTTVGAAVGHLQSASTTVVYDASLYGCGVWNAWAWASTSLTLLETQ